MTAWIGVDLDGTLAHFDHFRGWNHVGDPVAEIVDLVKRLLLDGVEVRVFTARVAPVGSIDGSHIEIAKAAIEAWCKMHVGQRLQVTCIKDVHCIRIYDDIAVAVRKNVGELLHF